MVAALLGDAADGVGAVFRNLSIKSTLSIRQINKIGDEAAEDVWKKGLESEELRRRREVRMGGIRNCFFVYVEVMVPAKSRMTT